MTNLHADHFKRYPFWLLTYCIVIGLFYGLWVYVTLTSCDEKRRVN